MFQIWINLGRVLASLIGLYFVQSGDVLHQTEPKTNSSPIMASVSVSGQNKDKNDLLVIKQIGKFFASYLWEVYP